MPTILNTESVYFNDVNLIPNLGVVKSREDVPRELYRIIVSPMSAIVGETFTKKAAQLGLSITTPRYISNAKKQKLYNIFYENSTNENQVCFISIGMENQLKDLLYLRDINNLNVLVDIANGYVPHLKDGVYFILQSIGKSHFDKLMVGNVVTASGINKICDELDLLTKELNIRVGIGNGSICASSDVTSVNRGQITELMECWETKNYYNLYKRFFGKNTKVNLVSDGGISKSGFVMKAFGAGADYCLMGGYFSKAREAEAHISGDGIYYGCASKKQIELAGLNKHSEGKEIKIELSQLESLEHLVEELWGGIASGISYSGYANVSEFIGNGVFEKKNNSLPPKIRI